MYPGRTDFFLKQYEEAVKRPYGYLLIDLITTTRDDCRLRTNVLLGEEGFKQIETEFIRHIVVTRKKKTVGLCNDQRVVTS